MDLKLDTFVPEMFRNFLNEQANSNWMQFKPQLERDVEKYISEIVCKVLTALLEKVPIRHFLLLWIQINTNDNFEISNEFSEVIWQTWKESTNLYLHFLTQFLNKLKKNV